MLPALAELAVVLPNQVKRDNVVHFTTWRVPHQGGREGV